MGWTSGIPKIVAELEARAKVHEHEVGLHGQEVAKAHARIRTGYMRDHIIWDRAHSALVGEAPYTIFHEFGTRHMSAQPMFAPALLEMQRYSNERLRMVVV